MRRFVENQILKDSDIPTIRSKNHFDAKAEILQF